jgi:hypothetical protein
MLVFEREIFDARPTLNLVCVIVGWFKATTMTMDGVTLTGNGTNAATVTEDIFVAKLTASSGTVVWAKAFGGS